MSTHPARLFASALLLGGGFIVGVAVLVAVAEARQPRRVTSGAVA